MIAMLTVALVIIAVAIIAGLVVLAIMLRDGYRNRGVADEDDWGATPMTAGGWWRSVM